MPDKDIAPAPLWTQNVPEQWPCADFSLKEEELSVVTRFERVANQYPNRTAAKYKNAELTYQELNRLANRIAHAIADKHLDLSRPAILLTRNTLASIAGMLGILKSGKAYVVLNPDLPAERLSLLHENCNCDLVLTTDDSVAACNSIRCAGTTMLNVDHLDCALPDSNPQVTTSADSTAAIFYTSGSQGHPKGVIYTHRSVLHVARVAIMSGRLSHHDRIGMLCSCSAGRALQDVFSTLLSGATLLPFDFVLEGFASCSAWLIREKISVIYFVPSMFRGFIASLDTKGKFPELRLLALGGESIRHSDIKLYRDHFSDACVLRLGLGITEACSTVTQVFINRFTHLSGDIPAGFPTDGNQVSIVNSDGIPLATGEVGEIVIKGSYVSPGYWRNPELTQRAFRDALDEPGVSEYRTGDLGYLSPEGCLFHRGRIDDQVKVRGNRVALEEVKSSIVALEGVTDALIVHSSEASDNACLIAYVVTSERQLTPTTLRDHLGKTLPSYMLPKQFVLLPHLPLMPGGKVDRTSLLAATPKTVEASAPFVAPRDFLEQRVFQEWSNTLQSDEHGVYDNFFDVGGDSLLSLQLIARIEKEFQVELPSKDFFVSPTIANLASLVRASNVPSLHSSRDHTKKTVANDAMLSAPPEKLRQLFTHSEVDGSATKAAIINTWTRRHRLLSFAGNLLPYTMVFRILDFASRTHWLRFPVFGQKIQLIRDFVSAIDTDVDPEFVIKNSLVYASLRQCHIGRWSFFPRDKQHAQVLADQINTEGQERLDHAVRKKRGVILVNAHSVASRSTSLVVPFDYFVGSASSQLRLLKLDRNYYEGALNAHKLNVARRVLEQGGIIGIAADGVSGNSPGFQCNFHGRRREFRSGFAELALLTNAEVVPVLHSVTNEGSVEITFGESFDTGNESMTHAERVEVLMTQYIKQMEQMWAHSPWLVTWHKMQIHLTSPHMR